MHLSDLLQSPALDHLADALQTHLQWLANQEQTLKIVHKLTLIIRVCTMITSLPKRKPRFGKVIRLGHRTNKKGPEV